MIILAPHISRLSVLPTISVNLFKGNIVVSQKKEAKSQRNVFVVPQFSVNLTEISSQFNFTRKAKAASGRLFFNRAKTRPTSGSITFRQPCLSYTQSLIKIGGAILEKNEHETKTLCNFNTDT